jgi:predicted ABC-type ATPase
LPEHSATPTLMIVAGPNGSGKSTFFSNYLSPQFPIFINADEIARTLTEIPERERNLAAAEQAGAARLRLLDERRSFAFETVFSRTDYWLDFIRTAKSRGFRVHLSFICTEAPALNVARVAERVEAGGHPVTTDKVTARYPRSIQTATLEDVLDHFDHAVRLAGVDHVGMGSDFDLDTHPAYDIAGLNQTNRVYALTEGLLRRGYSNEDVALMLGGNFERALQQIWTKP